MAQLKLGELYQLGVEGLRRDLCKAVKWYDRVLDQSDDEHRREAIDRLLFLYHLEGDAKIVKEALHRLMGHIPKLQKRHEH